MDKIAEIRTKKQASYQTLRDLFASLNDADWQRPVYGHEQGWTVRDTLAHMVSAGRGLLQAAQLIADGALKMPADFDLDRWNQRQVEKQADRTPADLLDDLAAVTQNTLAYLDRLSAGEDAAAILARRGRHAVFGDTTVEFILRRTYRHEREHAQDIRAALSG